MIDLSGAGRLGPALWSYWQARRNRLKQKGLRMKPQLVSWPEASKYIYHSGTLLVDLRNREAYEEAHISGAWNIPYEELDEHMNEVMNYDHIIFYCDHGNHSLKAARELSRKGKWASSIAGGYEEIRK